MMLSPLREMETKIVKIGNSKGIIVPSEIVELLRIKDKVQIVVEANRLIITPLNSNPRANWDEQFKCAISTDDDSELIPDVFEDEEFDDWTW